MGGHTAATLAAAAAGGVGENPRTAMAAQSADGQGTLGAPGVRANSNTYSTRSTDEEHKASAPLSGPAPNTVTTPTEMMIVYPPGAEHPVLYQQVGSPAQTPTSPPSTNTPPVSPHAVQGKTGVPPSPAHARSSGPKMSPVREPTESPTNSGAQEEQDAKEKWFGANMFKAVTARTSSIRSTLSG